MYFSCKDLDEKPFNSLIAPNQLQIPTAMISLDMWMPPSSFVDKWGLIDVGQLGPAGRSNIYSFSKIHYFSSSFLDLGGSYQAELKNNIHLGKITGRSSKTKIPWIHFCSQMIN